MSRAEILTPFARPRLRNLRGSRPCRFVPTFLLFRSRGGLGHGPTEPLLGAVHDVGQYAREPRAVGNSLLQRAGLLAPIKAQSRSHARSPSPPSARSPHGRIEIDSNVVERAIRPIALGRKNHLFAGSDGGGEHWAVIASLIETCKMNGINPQGYLRDVLAKIVARHPIHRLDDLLPFAYVSAADQAVA